MSTRSKQCIPADSQTVDDVDNRVDSRFLAAGSDLACLRPSASWVFCLINLILTCVPEGTLIMVLDPMTGEEQEPQDLRIVIAHKVKCQVPLLLETSQDMHTITQTLSE